MANPKPTTTPGLNVYQFNWQDKRNGAYTLQQIPVAPVTVPSSHQLNQDITTGNGFPTNELIPHGVAATLEGTSKGFEQGAHNYPKVGGVLGPVAHGLDVVTKVNDGINIVQHLRAERYREATIEFGGAVGQTAGGMSGAAIANAVVDTVATVFTVHPAARIISVVAGATGGSYLLSEAAKDLTRQVTAPNLPADLDIKPTVVVNGTSYALVVVNGKHQWYQIVPPEDPEPVIEAAHDPLLRLPDTRETYIPVTSTNAVNALTDTFMRKALPAQEYQRYQEEVKVLESDRVIRREGNIISTEIDGKPTWVRVHITPSPTDGDLPTANDIQEEHVPVSPAEAIILNRAQQITDAVSDGFSPAPRPFTPLPSYAGDHPTLTVQPGDTIGAIAQSLAMTPGEYSAYLRTVYGPDANLNDLLPGRTLPVPPEVVERLPQFNTLTEVPSGDAQPNSPHLANAADTLLPSPESFGSPAYSFNKPVNDEALAQQPWTTANAYAQGTQSALSFLQALQQGNELSAAVAGVSMLNAFSRATGHGQYFSNTTTAGLGAASATMNLYDALKADDNLGALAAATNLGSQVATLYAANASTQAAAQTAGTWANGLGTAAGILGIANSLKHGDETGAAISALIAFGGPAGALVGTVLAIGRALRGPKEPPEVHGEAEVVWTTNGNFDIRVSADQNGGGERARSTLASLLVSVEGYLGKEQDAHGDPHFALIPQRLPSVIFHGQYESHLILRTRDEEGRPVERYYDGAGNRIGLDGSIESTFAEDFLNEVMEHNAIVPKWEADTVRARINHGDSQAWKEETLPTPEAVKGGLMALTFHIPGASSEDAGTSARFDLDHDGYLDPVDWTQPYQAFLALDRDQNGIIDSGKELLTFTPPPPSFPPPEGEGGEPMRAPRASIHSRTASLDWLDANNDGILNADDPAFGALKLWLDVNGNAHTDDGELATLSQLGITAIDFRGNPPVIVDGEGHTQPLTPKHLIPKGEGARISANEGGTQIELQDGYRAFYLRAGDSRLQSALPSSSVQEELARHTSNMSREAQGLFGGHAALLTGLAVAQTAAAGNVPATPLTLQDVEHAIAAAQSARTLSTDGSRHYGESATATPTVHADGDRTSSAPILPSPSFPLPEGEGGEPKLAWLAPVNSGTPAFADGIEARDARQGWRDSVFTNPLTTGEIISGAEDTALILTPDALLANDFSRNSNATLRISAVGNATRGTVALLDTGEVVFTPELNYFGPASFTYTVSDQWGYASGALATVNLASVNDAPVVDVLSDPLGYLSDTHRHTVRKIPKKVHEDFHNFSQQQGALAATDPDGPGPITYAIQSGDGPARGYASVDAAGNWSYRSIGGTGHGQAGQVGTFDEAFTVTVADGAGGQTRARIDTRYYYNYSEDTDRGFLPVALDLNGNGLDFTGIDDSNVYFDVNGDGWREHIAWTGANDGLLVLDTDGDRVIDRPEEIAFARYLAGAVTDLEGLNAFDSNDDGILDKLDARFNDFAVWQDANQNGISEAGEVKTLAERNIDSINLTSDQVPQTYANGDVTLAGTSTYTTSDGQTHLVGDAAFRYTNETVPANTAAAGSAPEPSPSFPPPSSPSLLPPGEGGEPMLAPVYPDQAEVMRMALVFVQTVATLGADTTSDPLSGGIAATPTDPLIVPDDPMGMMAGTPSS